ncbi:hypothetical protein KI387_024655, partial [Taxus chinensis]
SVEKGIGIDAKDGIMGKGGIDVGEVVDTIKYEEVDVIYDEVEIGDGVGVGIELIVDVERGG